MPRYAALLRGVSPVTCAMPDLRRAFEHAGFGEVRTVLSSGNVLFDADSTDTASLQARAQASMARVLGRAFPVFLRRVDALARLLRSEPYRGTALPPGSKRVVTFLRTRPRADALRLPVERDGARVCAVRGLEAFSAYVRSPKGPVFMTLLEETFGTDVTTRTWDTVERLARVGRDDARSSPESTSPRRGAARRRSL